MSCDSCGSTAASAWTPASPMLFSARRPQNRHPFSFGQANNTARSTHVSRYAHRIALQLSRVPSYRRGPRLSGAAAAAVPRPGPGHPHRRCCSLLAADIHIAHEGRPVSTTSMGKNTTKHTHDPTTAHSSPHHPGASRASKGQLFQLWQLRQHCSQRLGACIVDLALCSWTFTHPPSFSTLRPRELQARTIEVQLCDGIQRLSVALLTNQLQHLLHRSVLAEMVQQCATVAASNSCNRHRRRKTFRFFRRVTAAAL